MRGEDVCDECLSGECFANVCDDIALSEQQSKRFSDHEIEVAAFSAVSVIEADV